MLAFPSRVRLVSLALAVGCVAAGWATRVAAEATVCELTCPANITVSAQPPSCSATVNYPAPMATGACSVIVCAPASGGTYPQGTTTVTCADQGEAAMSEPADTSAWCSFTVTVNPTAPAIICRDQTFDVQLALGTTSTPIDFSLPEVAGSCAPIASNTCDPPPGSSLPPGTTAVSCAVTDTQGRTSTCTKRITVNARVVGAPIAGGPGLALLIAALGGIGWAATRQRRFTSQ